MISVTRYDWIIGFYIAWIAAHYAATQAYVKYCTPDTFWGFITYPFIASTPQCERLRWVISMGKSNIATMWVLSGVWVTSNIVALWYRKGT